MEKHELVVPIDEPFNDWQLSLCLAIAESGHSSPSAILRLPPERHLVLGLGLEVMSNEVRTCHDTCSDCVSVCSTATFAP